MISPNGKLIELTHGGYEASIASVGATMRTLSFDGRALVVGYGAQELRPLFRGTLLAPWPNRVVDGRYTFAGREHLLPINEHDRGHALHGLVEWLDFDVVGASAASARLQGVITARTGYPFTVRVRAQFDLTDTGLVSTVTATNLGDDVAPYGIGGHPYLVAGTSTIDETRLHVPAEQFLEVTGERLLPGQVRHVAEADGDFLDFRSRRQVGSTQIDHAYTGLDLGPGGICTVTLTRADGHGASMHWNGRHLPWVQVHTADRPEMEWNRIGLAVEPMSCPPDAFNSGIDLVALEPGGSHSASWTIGAVTP